MTFPLFALMATKYPSRLPKKTVLPCTASPRFTGNSIGKSDGMGRSYSQTLAPVFASKAKTCARIRNGEYCSVDHKWCCFDILTIDVELLDPAHAQISDVLGSNFSKRRVSPSIIRAGICQPFIRIGSGS